MSDRGRRFANEDDEAQYYLGVLRDGTREQKIEARERLSQLFEARGMLAEACELLEGNARAGVLNRIVLTRLASLYRRTGRPDDADAAMVEAAKYLDAPLPPARQASPPTTLDVQPPRQQLAPRAMPSQQYLTQQSQPQLPNRPLGPDERMLAEVHEILTPNERVLGYAIQSKVALSIRKDAVIATTNRLILYRPSILGGRNFDDILWEDIADVQFQDGLMSSQIRIVRANRRGLDVLGSLEKVQARQIYVICQQKEQEWREKRRIRRMEEDRARAGGVHVNNNIGGQMGAQEDPMEKLARAKAMLDNGLITEAEYETIKARVISSF